MADWFTFDCFRNAVYPRQQPGNNPCRDQTTTQLEAFWTPNETTLEIARDFQQFPQLPLTVQHTIFSILLFLFGADSYVSQLTTEAIAAEYPDIITKGMLSIHGFMEIIHAQAYGLILEVPYGGAVDLEDAYKRISSSPAIVAMLAWGRYYNQPGLSLNERLLGLLAFELIIFTPLFNPIYAIKAKGLLPAICSTNEFVARDELIHGNNVLILLHRQRLAGNPVTEQQVRTVFVAAMKLANGLISEALPVDVPEYYLCKHDAIYFTKTIANRAMAALGFDPLEQFNWTMPDYLAKIGMGQFTSFHNLRPTEYLRAVESEDSDLSLPLAQVLLLEKYD